MLELCRGLPGATEEFPFGPDDAVFKVGGRMFALVSLEDEPGRVNLKCDQVYAQALREAFPAVRPGYHMDKHHWNTVVLDGSVPDHLLVEWIEESYDLVVAKLTRAARAAIGRP